MAGSKEEYAENILNYEILENGTLLVRYGVTEIGEGFFKDVNISQIKNIILPETLTSFGLNNFMGFRNLETINIPDAVTSIPNYCFYDCVNLKEVKLSNNIRSIGAGAFYNCESLEKIDLPDSVALIYVNAFRNCKNLHEIKLSNNIIGIGILAFAGCESLEKILIPSNCFYLDAHAFAFSNIHEVVLSPEIRAFNLNAFDGCPLENQSLIVPDSVEYINSLSGNNILNNFTFKSISIPLTAYFESSSFKFLKENFSNLEFRYKNKVFSPAYIEDKYDNIENKKILYRLYTGDIISVNMENKNVETYLRKQDYVNKITKWNHLDEISLADIDKLKNWVSYDILPHKVVVLNMPKKDIHLFYKDNNAKNWQELIKYANMSNDTNKASLFHLAYTLGFFSEDPKDRQIASDFIKNNIINRYNEDEIHQIFSGITTYEVPYNKEFAQFFMFNCKVEKTKGPYFLTYTTIDGEEIDLLSACHKNFDKILQQYPDKTMTTHISSEDIENGENLYRDKNRLLPKEAIAVVLGNNYKNVDEQAMDLAMTVAPYGLTQEQFELAQEWFLQGKNIPKENITLHIKEDKNLKLASNSLNEKTITYELLSKDDPTAVILGNATNCCQVVDNEQPGVDCVKYGLTQPNSGFLVFKNKDKIIGQAWVWYDESTKKVCLDNIEVPQTKYEVLENDKELQQEFLDCIERVADGFVQSMGPEKVTQVTVGVGYNDIVNILAPNYTIDKNPTGLAGYDDGYTDAIDEGQFIIKDLERTQKQVKSFDSDLNKN